jgi:heme/copper-type cytochrome/quinol oxidase subunit 2
MDDRYDNNQNDSYQDLTHQQPTVQEQLQYQYQPQPSNLEEPMTLGEWLVTMLIMLIPCVNIIMAFVWAFSSKEKKSKSNYFKAYLIFIAIVIVLYIILIAVFGVAIFSSMNSLMTA